jgi:acyl-CoA synthetase (AMP-forming)/AMP-acid ligase II
VLRPPPIHFQGELWSRDRLTIMAREWLAALPADARGDRRPIAMVMANCPEDAALFFALSCLPAPLILLPPDPRGWRSAPPLPERTRLVLAPSSGQLAGDAEDAGLLVTRLPSAGGREPSGGGDLPAPECPGVVAFTSGSTGGPKPVYRSSESLALEARAVARALGLQTGDAVLGTLPLAGIHGLVNALLLASLLEAELGLEPRFEHRKVLERFASRRYRYWGTTPFMADLLSTCALSGPAPPAPPVCKVSGGRLPDSVFEAFASRFGVRMRPAYGTTENGIITADMAPPESIRPAAVGQAVPGIAVRIGDDPLAPFPPGVTGRVWFTSPWYMTGYGFPPDLEPRAEHDGWWATQDLGQLDESGWLTLVGRLDDSFKTVSGHLVSPAQLEGVLRRHPQVVETAVAPVPSPAGPLIGAVVETPAPVHPSDLHAFAAPLLPAWSRPQVIVVTRRLPRLDTGKVDYAACVEILEREGDR